MFDIQDAWSVYAIVKDYSDYDLNVEELFISAIIVLVLLYLARLYVQVIVHIFDVLIWGVGVVIVCCVTWALWTYGHECFRGVHNCEEIGQLMLSNLQDALHGLLAYYKHRG